MTVAGKLSVNGADYDTDCDEAEHLSARSFRTAASHSLHGDARTDSAVNVVDQVDGDRTDALFYAWLKATCFRIQYTLYIRDRNRTRQHNGANVRADTGQSLNCLDGLNLASSNTEKDDGFATKHRGKA